MFGCSGCGQLKYLPCCQLFMLPNASLHQQEILDTAIFTVDRFIKGIIVVCLRQGMFPLCCIQDEAVRRL